MSSRGANGSPSGSTACTTWLSWMPFSQEMDFRFMIRSIGVPFPQKTASHQGSKTSSELCQLSSASSYSIDGWRFVMVHRQWRVKHFLCPMAAINEEHHEMVNSRWILLSLVADGLCSYFVMIIFGVSTFFCCQTKSNPSRCCCEKSVNRWDTE